MNMMEVRLGMNFRSLDLAVFRIFSIEILRKNAGKRFCVSRCLIYCFHCEKSNLSGTQNKIFQMQFWGERFECVFIQFQRLRKQNTRISFRHFPSNTNNLLEYETCDFTLAFLRNAFLWYEKSHELSTVCAIMALWDEKKTTNAAVFSRSWICDSIHHRNRISAVKKHTKKIHLSCKKMETLIIRRTFSAIVTFDLFANPCGKR